MTTAGQCPQQERKTQGGNGINEVRHTHAIGGNGFMKEAFSDKQHDSYHHNSPYSLRPGSPAKKQPPDHKQKPWGGVGRTDVLDYPLI
jgi:hypothetical protein